MKKSEWACIMLITLYTFTLVEDGAKTVRSRIIRLDGRGVKGPRLPRTDCEWRWKWPARDHIPHTYICNVYRDRDDRHPYTRFSQADNCYIYFRFESLKGKQRHAVTLFFRHTVRSSTIRLRLTDVAQNYI